MPLEFHQSRCVRSPTLDDVGPLFTERGLMIGDLGRLKCQDGHNYQNNEEEADKPSASWRRSVRHRFRG